MNSQTQQPHLLSNLVQAAEDAIAKTGVDAALPPVKRGSPGAGGEKYLRLDRGGPAGIFYYRTSAGKRRSLGVSGDRPDIAEAVLALRRNEERGMMIGRVNPDNVLFSAVVSNYLAHMEPGKHAPLHAHRDYEALKATFARLQQFFGKDATCGQVDAMGADEYIDWRTSEEGRVVRNYATGPRPGLLVKPVTAAYEIRKARAAAVLFSKKPRTRKIELLRGDLPRSEQRSEYLTQAQLVRLLLSARRGWVWDNAKNGWLVEDHVDPVTGLTTRRKVVHPRFAREGQRAVYEGRMLARAILFLYYTGSRSSVVHSIGWDESMERGWIDVHRGKLYRRGLSPVPVARPKGRKFKKTKLHPPAMLPRPLARFARAARRNDQRVGASYFLHDQFTPGEQLKGGTLLYRLKRAAKLAGLKIDVNLHTMRHTTCTTLLRRGCRIEDVAAFVGVTPKVIREHYGHVDEEVTWAAALLMEHRSLDVDAFIAPGRPHPLTVVRMRESDLDPERHRVRIEARRKADAEPGAASFTMELTPPKSDVPTGYLH